MFIGTFTERPYQDHKSGYFGAAGKSITDLSLSNASYDPRLGAELYNRYLDERVYAEEVGFDGLMLNEHHSTPFCMGGVMNVEAGILARITQRAKIVLLGNVLPIWDDPLWLAEELAEIDMISRGRLVTGWVRGTGRESVSHNAQPPFNWERFQEAHDFIVEAWTRPGPFRWEGEHFQYRYVNPWSRPYQEPHPQIWVPGVMSRNTVAWAAKRRYPYLMLATELGPTRESFAYYDDVAEETGYEAGTQHRGYLFKVHVDETEELAEEAGRKFHPGTEQPVPGREPGERAALPPEPPWPDVADEPAADGEELRGRGRTRASACPQGQHRDAGERGREREQAARGARYLRHLRAADREAEHRVGDAEDGHPPRASRARIPAPWHDLLLGRRWRDDHDDQMRSLRLMGEEVIPAVREIAKELDLKGPFEVDPITGKSVDGAEAAPPKPSGEAETSDDQP